MILIRTLAAAADSEALSETIPHDHHTEVTGRRHQENGHHHTSHRSLVTREDAHEARHMQAEQATILTEQGQDHLPQEAIPYGVMGAPDRRL